MRIYTGNWMYRLSCVSDQPDGTGRRLERVLIFTPSLRHYVTDYRDTGLDERPPAQAALFDLREAA